MAGQTFKNKMIVWENDRFEFPLRTRDEDGSIQEIRNINTDKPAAKFFKPIKGYQQVSSMLSVMGMGLADLTDLEGANNGQQSMQGFDMSEMMEHMEHMEQAVDDNLDEQQKNQMIELMQQAMDQFNGSDGSGQE
jgi:hypothetical protein